eukprot:Skav229389  [mRNA]  locus=scaffold4358:69560:76538:- [translate_table: standard]
MSEGIPPLVALLNDGNDEAKVEAAAALRNLAVAAENKVRIADAGALPPLVALLKEGNDEAKVQAAAALGNLGRVAENKVRIADAGALPPLVALLNDGNDEAKVEAAAALRNLAVAAENKVRIADAGALPPLVALLKDGNAEAKHQAEWALKKLVGEDDLEQLLLSPGVVEELRGTARHGTGAAQVEATEIVGALNLDLAIPSGGGTRVAMFSARFDGVHRILREHDYEVLMVDAGAGVSFGDLTMKYLNRLHAEMGTMLAVCTAHYGEMTASAYSSFEEIKFAQDYKSRISVLPLRVADTYPPEPPCGPDHPYDKERLAQGYILGMFKPSVVFLDCRGQSARQIAFGIAQELQKRKIDSKMKTGLKP